MEAILFEKVKQNENFLNQLVLSIMRFISRYDDFISDESLLVKARNIGRKAVIRGLSAFKAINSDFSWIRFPYYHHVFDDEKKDFERQLRYLKRFGDFISIDDACALIVSKSSFKGRYFCLSFDDGFYNCYSNMMEITAGLDVPVIVYLPTNYIGLAVNDREDQQKILKFYPEKNKPVAFLNWEDCKKMLSYQMTFGSHTCSHVNLAKLTAEAIEQELCLSKKAVEENLNVECKHFACPWGRPGLDFYPEQTTDIARKSGYLSFATTQRGKMSQGDDLMLIKRDHLLAKWENFQLRYFFSR